MTGPALWRAEGVTEGEDAAKLTVCGDPPSTTGHRPAVFLPGCARRETLFFPRRHAWNTALVPGFTICARRATSQLVRRMQPWLSVRPISSGCGVPWMP